MKNERARKRSWSLWLAAIACIGLLRSSLAATGDEFWDARFGNPGANGSLYTMSFLGNELYAGGRFSEIGGALASNIARWDGTNWFPVGGGVSGGVFPNVLASVILDGELYIGGLFTEAGGQPVGNIARWDGSSWFSLGAGVNSLVRAMATDGTNLYVAGTFSQAGGINATNIAKWDGSNWSAVGDGIPGTAVDCIAARAGRLYAGGRFRLGAGINATNIAMWNGTGWVGLAEGIRDNDSSGGTGGIVRAVTSVGNSIVAAGDFRLAGKVTAENIATWDGNTWKALAIGIGPPGSVESIAVVGSSLYVGGFFSYASGVAAKAVAKWDGVTWTPLGSGTISGTGAGSVSAIISNGTELFVGGVFETAGGTASTNIALWHIPHALNVERVGNQMRLSWPATGTNFLLEACVQLLGTNWTEVAQAPARVDDQLVVTNDLDGASRFYRLRKK